MPLFDGAIVRPVSASACVDRLRFDIAESYGVEIAARDVSPYLVGEDRSGTAFASDITAESGIIPLSTSADACTFAGTSIVSGSTTEAYPPGIDTTSIRGLGGTEAAGAPTDRERTLGPVALSSWPLPGSYKNNHAFDAHREYK